MARLSSWVFSPVLLSFLLLLVSPVSADDESPFDCHLTVNGSTFDLTSLKGEHTANQTRASPPTSMVDSLRFDLCSDLKLLDHVSERDQCPSGTRACLTTTNKKSDEPDRIVSVIPIVQSSSLKYTILPGLSATKFISISFQGPDYPHPTNSTPTAQFMNLTIFCNPDKTSDPEFKSYDGAEVQVQWNAPAGCPFQEGGGEPNGDDSGSKGKERTVGSGIGWFFLMLLLAFAAYLGLGAYYNYTTYGASGADLFPHRDFWKEVPYMLNDVVSHLCSTVRPRRTSGRGGYIAV